MARYLNVLRHQPLPRIKGESLYQDPGKPQLWRLLETVEVTLSNGYHLVIPAGYTTDFASVPGLLQGIAHQQGRHNLAVLIHDWLYDSRYDAVVGEDWKQDRVWSDREMLIWMLVCGDPVSKSLVFYGAVRIGGRRKWLN